ncbi:MAG TPA: CBS domain-containing protein [Candidatus Rubrimentiphilum sp.]|nr:CBS domain-containing protein [Candidatus Rubrimentiphilum sp.]
MAQRASDIMTTDVTVIREEETLRDAAQRLAQGNIGALPICDDQKHIKGMLTDRDIVVHVVARGKDPSQTRARELEMGEVVSVRPDDSLEHVEDLMAQHQIRRLPVVDDGEVVGMISQADIARNAAPHEAGRVVKEISKN